MTQLVDQIRSRYNFNADHLKAYDHAVREFPAALSFLGTDDPISGSYLAHELTAYPTPSGRAILGPSDANRKTSYSGVDLSNGLVIEGQYQAFWGVQDLTTANNVSSVPFAVVTEGIVTLGGVAKYRGVQTLTGRIFKNRVVISGVTVTPSSLAISGLYESLNVETLDNADTRVPCRFDCRLVYQAVWVRQ